MHLEREANTEGMESIGKYCCRVYSPRGKRSALNAPGKCHQPLPTKGNREKEEEKIKKGCRKRKKKRKRKEKI